MRSISLLALAIWLAGAGHTWAAGDPFEVLGVQAILSPTPSPALSLPDLAGRVVAVPEAFQGEVVVVGFFTTT